MSAGQASSGFIPYGYSLSVPVIGMSSNRTRIQLALITLAKSGMFFAVKYDPTSGLPITINPYTEQPVTPATALANERSSVFTSDPTQGRRHSRKRRTWLFDLIIEFDLEASVEFFEESILDQVITLPTDSDLGLPVTFVQLINSSIQHPVKQQSTKGTRAVFTFDAQVGRI